MASSNEYPISSLTPGTSLRIAARHQDKAGNAITPVRTNLKGFIIHMDDCGVWFKCVLKWYIHWTELASKKSHQCE